LSLQAEGSPSKKQKIGYGGKDNKSENVCNSNPGRGTAASVMVHIADGMVAKATIDASKLQFDLCLEELKMAIEEAALIMKNRCGMHTRIARFICKYLVIHYLFTYNIRIFHFAHVDISVCDLGEFTYQ
jgi:hypothetical protein